ncbi:MAG TPA: SDR family NAD(P)-dependent oxidoreductase, partial [Ktedonosporobacter sp.]|nr:SDR family NAD(P)-dependent oxidoreductase [Ktedonosporobacter sp.]
MQERLVALVTGGSRGIGAETALALAEQGCDVVFTYRNKAARAEEMAATIMQKGGEALALHWDSTQPDNVTHLFQEVVAPLRANCLPLATWGAQSCERLSIPLSPVVPPLSSEPRSNQCLYSEGSRLSPPFCSFQIALDFPELFTSLKKRGSRGCALCGARGVPLRRQLKHLNNRRGKRDHVPQPTESESERVAGVHTRASAVC